ncbi:hypothetical protein H0H81_008374 [Sphagnurus paluster]|uniref:Calcineurin-like phosphoesterase domain-containing protein n=1 Tax=Sphagnurus paluster TaxID=117069 RepID=A0A9P7KJ12_9AGAR|nr:hypothetical protein H0H81_008374 [Sphagnurus paluster]
MKLSFACLVASGLWTVFSYPLSREYSNNAIIPAPNVNQKLLVDIKVNLEPYEGRRRITFKQDGTFKLTVFSDLHFGENPGDSTGPEKDANSTRVIRTILGRGGEVINGDLTTGERTFAHNSTLLINQIVRPFVEANVPFATTQGNHDNQPNISHRQVIEHERSLTKLSYTRPAPDGIGGEGGPGNYWVPVYRNEKDKAPVLILWFFDSRGGVTSGDDSRPIPAYVDASVAQWIENETQAMNAAWGPASQRAAVAFVHIPPNTVRNIVTDPERNPGLHEDVLGDSSVQTPDDAPFWNSFNKNIKNIHAVISGHDHGSEWCARETVKDVIFCFNKHTGYGGYGPQEWGFGVRNLQFTSPDPRAPVKTWIRLENGQTRAAITLDERYKR